MNDPNPSNEDYFKTGHLTPDLRSESIRGGAAVLGGQVSKTILNLLAVVVLARILTPADFGLIAMVAAVTNFVRMFKDMGLSMATVQRAEVSHQQVSTLFWINVAFTVSLVLLVSALSPAIAWFYGDARLTWITVALAAGILFGGLSVQHEAILKRQMRFTLVAIVEVGSVVGSVAVAIVAAAAGASYWALVLQQVSRGLFGSIGAWIACRWRPGKPVYVEGVGSMLSFGGYLTGFNLVNYLGRNGDDILIGKFLGAQSLGFYTKAYDFLLAPIQLIRSPISHVVIPSLSRLQNDPEAFQLYFKKALSVVVFLSMPLVTFCFIESERLVLLLLGDQWTETIPIFRVLATVAFIQTFNMAIGWSYTSLGQTRRWFYWGILHASVLVLGFAIGLNWGALGVAMSYVATTYTILLPSFWFCFRTSHVSTALVFRAVWRAATASVAAAVGAYLLMLQVATDGVFFPLALAGGLFAALYLTVWMLLPQGQAYLVSVRGLAKELR